MHEPTAADNTAVLVSLDFGAPDYAESLDELRLLAESAGVRTIALVEGKRQRPDAHCLRAAARWMKSPPSLSNMSRVPSTTALRW